MAKWYYQHDGKPIGPISQAQMRDWVTQKAVLPTQLVRQEGSSEWQAAGLCSALFGEESAEVAEPMPQAQDLENRADATTVDGRPRSLRITAGIAMAAGLLLRLSSHGIAWPAHYSYSGPREGTVWAVREAALNDIAMSGVYLGGILLIGTLLVEHRRR